MVCASVTGPDYRSAAPAKHIGPKSLPPGWQRRSGLGHHPYPRDHAGLLPMDFVPAERETEGRRILQAAHDDNQVILPPQPKHDNH